MVDKLYVYFFTFWTPNNDCVGVMHANRCVYSCSLDSMQASRSNSNFIMNSMLQGNLSAWKFIFIQLYGVCLYVVIHTD